MKKMAEGRFELKAKIGSGAFGEVYLAKMLNKEEDVAIKIENCKSRQGFLQSEYKLLKYLANKGIPEIYWFGIEGDYYVLAMELLGPTLDELFEFCQNKFSLNTSLQIAKQIIERIEYVHSKYFIHRDIKPQNLLIGEKKNSNIIYLVDFGLAKRYIDPKSKSHIQFRNDRNLIGTMRYASINTHIGIEQSRRDDLESIFYNIIYFVKGGLPWQGIKIKNKEEKLKKIMEHKMSTLIENLCKGLPSEFIEIFNLIKKLQFEEMPNYKRIQQLIGKMIIKNQKMSKFEFDWKIKVDNPLSKISNSQYETIEKGTKLEACNKVSEINEKNNLDNTIKISQNKRDNSSKLLEYKNSIFSLVTPTNISNMTQMETSIIQKAEPNSFELSNTSNNIINNNKFNEELIKNQNQQQKKEDKKDCCSCNIV